MDEYTRAYNAELRRRREEKECLSHESKEKQSHENIMRTSHEKAVENEYKELVKQLDDWNVTYRHYILKHYPVSCVREAIARTKYNQQKVRHSGAYFCQVIRSLHMTKSV